MSKKLWQFKTKNFVVTWYIEPDVLDTSYMDPALAKECREKVKSREWKCFQSVIEVKEKRTKRILGEAYLGGSIYANPSEFRDHFGMNQKGHGSYFSQMVREAIRDARREFKNLQQTAADEIRANQKLLEIRVREVKKRELEKQHA